MPLHPQVQTFMTGVESMGLPPFETLGLEEGRQYIETVGRSFMIPAEEVASVVDTVVPGPDADIPVRIFMPEGEGLRPGILYFHGGGFSTGSAHTRPRPGKREGYPPPPRVSGLVHGPT